MTAVGSPQYPGGRGFNPNDMPQVVERQRQQRLQQVQVGNQEYGSYQEQVEPHQPGTTVAFNWLWPIICWSLALYNIIVLGTTAVAMAFSPAGYNAWTHAQAVIIACLTLAAMSISYKWILMGPDGMPWSRSTKSEQPTVPITPPVV